MIAALVLACGLLGAGLIVSLIVLGHVSQRERTVRQELEATEGAVRILATELAERDLADPVLRRVHQLCAAAIDHEEQGL